MSGHGKEHNHIKICKKKLFPINIEKLYQLLDILRKHGPLNHAVDSFLKTIKDARLEKNCVYK